MESVPDIAFSVFGKAGRCYGILFRIRGQAHVFGATERGIFYRIGARVTESESGHWNALFGLRTRIGIAELMIKRWMKNDVVVVHFRGARIRGSMHFSSTGIISFIGGSKLAVADAKASQKYLPDNYQTNEGDSINSNQSRHTLDSYSDW